MNMIIDTNSREVRAFGSGAVAGFALGVSFMLIMTIIWFG
jgi:hypothetical protein